MREIAIREKLAPYSLLAGTKCWVPRSDWEVVASLEKVQVVGGDEWEVEVGGSVSEFCVQMDLERDSVWISGLTSQGRYCLKLTAEVEGLVLGVRRVPSSGLWIRGERCVAGERRLIARGGRLCAAAACERLSFGNWKAQDWSLLCKRRDPKELLPLLFLLRNGRWD